MAGDAWTASDGRNTREKLRLLWRFGAPVVKFVFNVLIAIAFFGVVMFFVDEYLQQRTMFSVVKVANPPPLLPPVSVCPFPPFNPARLVRLGLNTSLFSVRDLTKTIETLSGLDQHLTGRELVDATAWRVQEIIEEVKVENHHEVYDEREPETQLWRRSLLPPGPCLTMTSPRPVGGRPQNLTIKIRAKPLGLDLCENIKNDGNFAHTLCLPSYLNQNESLWEEYMKSEFYLFFLVYTSSTQRQFQNYIANTDMKIAFGENIYAAGSVMHYEVSYIQDEDYDEHCFNRCVTKDRTKKENCEVMNEQNFGLPIHELCVKQHQQANIAAIFLLGDNTFKRCQRKCFIPRTHLNQWVWQPAKTRPPSLYINIYHSSSVTTKLTEELIYPEVYLFADVGGAMGLFLGTSLLDLWKTVLLGVQSLANVLQSLGLDFKTRSFEVFIHLSELVGDVVLAIVASTHFSLTIMNYGLQTKQVVVSLRSSEGFTPNDVVRPGHEVQDFVKSHLASRPLGCRLPTLSSTQKCLIHCLLDKAYQPPIPLVEVEELSECSEKHLTLPRRMYIVFDYLVQHIVEKQRVDVCVSKCGSANITSGGFGKVHFVVDEILQISTGKLVSTFGGIIGLYFGFSLLNTLLNFLKGGLQYLKCSASQTKFTRFAITAMTMLISLLMVSIQIHSYFMEHPLYNTYSEKFIENKDIPAVTTCIWPPFNPRRLLELAGLGEEYKRVVGAEGTRNHSVLTPLFKALEKVPNNLDLRHLWMYSAWNNHEVNIHAYIASDFIRETTDFALKNSAIFTHCRTFTPNLYIDGSMKDLPYEIDFKTKNESISSYVAVHSQDDLPILEPDFVSSRGYVSINVQQMQSWSGIFGKTIRYGNCTMQCLEKALEDQMQCLLPWVVKQQTHPICNLTQVTKFLTALWRLGPSPEYIYGALLGNAAILRCRQECHAHIGSFYSFFVRYIIEKSSQGLTAGHTLMEEEVPPFELSTMVRIETDISGKWVTHDSYPLPRLLGDLGGIAGMTLGTSMMSFVSSIFECLYW